MSRKEKGAAPSQGMPRATKSGKSIPYRRDQAKDGLIGKYLFACTNAAAL